MRKISLLVNAVILFFVTVTPVFVIADDDPVSFVSHFYEGYLNNRVFESVDKREAYLRVKPFFSRSFKDLTAKNHKLCGLSRGDDICGFDADGDIYLSAQEFGPHLNFKTSGFNAGLSASNSVDASFTVWPGEHDYYQREMRFKMAKEGGNWRVDDIGFKSGKGFFSFARSRIADENAFLTAQAKDLQTTWNWIRLYVTSEDKAYNDRASRYFSFPLEVCDENGKCESIQRKDKRVAETIHSLHNQPFMTGKDEEFGKKESMNPKKGDQARKDALIFRFEGAAWWIVKIDFSMQGVAVAGQPPSARK